MALTRRHALRSAAALLAVLAGCNDSPDTPTPDESDGSNRFDRPENVAMDPPTVTLRRPGSRDPIVDVADADGESNRTARERHRTVERGFVTSPEAASLLRIGDVEGADDARRFVAETDFDAQFLFVDRGTVRQCYRRVLCYVTWTEFELRRTYAEVYRDYDAACSTDARDRVARFVRLDGSVDPRRIESGGTHTQRGGCPIPRWELDDRFRPGTGTATADGTPAAGDTPADARTTDGADRFDGGDR